MRRSPLLAALFLSGCLAYPKVYHRTLKGTARLDDGKPITIKAQLIKSCDEGKGETEKVIRERETRTDDKGNYELKLQGMAWNTRSLLTEAGCQSRIQLFVCREVCKPADEIDINVLGK